MPSGRTSKPVLRRSRRRRCGGDSDRSWCRDLLLFDFLPLDTATSMDNAARQGEGDPANARAREKEGGGRQ